jgi:hypothetical protein
VLLGESDNATVEAILLALAFADRDAPTDVARSIAWGLSRWAEEEATRPARSVPRRCRRIQRRAARMLRVSTMG